MDSYSYLFIHQNEYTYSKKDMKISTKCRGTNFQFQIFLNSIFMGQLE